MKRLGTVSSLRYTCNHDSQNVHHMFTLIHTCTHTTHTQALPVLTPQATRQRLGKRRVLLSFNTSMGTSMHITGTGTRRHLLAALKISVVSRAAEGLCHRGQFGHL